MIALGVSLALLAHQAPKVESVCHVRRDALRADITFSTEPGGNEITLAKVKFFDGHKPWSQVLKQPPGFRFQDDFPLSERPKKPIGFLRGGSAPVLWWLLRPVEDGVYETQIVAILSWKHHRWELCHPVDRVTFNDMDDMFVRNGKIYICEDELERGRVDPNKFILSTYEFKKGRLRLVSQRKTKKLYYPFVPGWPARPPVPKKIDPLSEFGLRWSWGGLD